MKNNNWILLALALLVSIFMSCKGGDTRQLNNNPGDVPDSPTYSDSPIAGQPNGYAPAGSGNSDSVNSASVDSATKEGFQ